MLGTTIIPSQNKCFRGYTGISLSVHPCARCFVFPQRFLPVQRQISSVEPHIMIFYLQICIIKKRKDAFVADVDKDQIYTEFRLSDRWVSAVLS